MPLRGMRVRLLASPGELAAMRPAMEAAAAALGMTWVEWPVEERGGDGKAQIRDLTGEQVGWGRVAGPQPGGLAGYRSCRGLGGCAGQAAVHEGEGGVVVCRLGLPAFAWGTVKGSGGLEGRAGLGGVWTLQQTCLLVLPFAGYDPFSCPCSCVPCPQVWALGPSLSLVRTRSVVFKALAVHPVEVVRWVSGFGSTGGMMPNFGPVGAAL